MTQPTPKIDIRPDHWEMVRGILQKHVPHHEVWVFGSRATWTAKEFSDLDLAVIGDQPLSLSVSSSLSDDFSESDLPYKVDVVDWATTSESFQKIIERDRVVVQKAGQSGAMQSDWRDVTLGEFVRLQQGHDLTASVSLRIPSRRIQDKIVDVVHSIDQKISLNRRINQTLEAMAQALFKSWFVDFDPVKAKIAAKAEGRDPLRAAMSAISGKGDAELDALPPEAFDQLATTAALFPDEMGESALGEIPRGWTHAALSTVCDLNCSSWGTKTLPASVKYVDLANTKNGEIVEVQKMAGANIPSRARRILESGDTIVGTVRPGNRSFALVGEVGLTGSTGFAVVHPKTDFLREYVYLAATSDANIERLTHLADGGAYPAVRPELVVSNAGPVPSSDLLRAFHRVSSSVFDQILANRKANQGLVELRDTLLPKLLSGELSVTQDMAEVEA